MNIIVDGLLINYTLSGKGKLIVLLHGWGDSSQTFKDLTPRLARSYQILNLDLPGFGASEAPKIVWNLDNYAGILEHMLSKLNLNQPYAVIGHSNGGALAIRSIAEQRLTPQKLILVAASGVRSSKKIKRLILKVIAKVGNIATIWLPKRTRQSLRKRLYGVAGSDLLVVPELAETFKQTVRQDVQSDAAKLGLPTLLLYSAQDSAVPLSDGQKLSSLIKGSRLEVVENAGHFIHLDQPDAVAAKIEAFLA